MKFGREDLWAQEGHFANFHESMDVFSLPGTRRRKLCAVREAARSPFRI